MNHTPSTWSQNFKTEVSDNISDHCQTWTDTIKMVNSKTKLNKYKTYSLFYIYSNFVVFGYKYFGV